MRLQNERMAGVVLAFGNKNVTVDGRGCIDTDDKDVAASLAASGFTPVYAKKSEPAKVETPKVDEPKTEALAEEESAVRPEPKGKGKNRG